jgi:hypothetical protein
MQLVLSNNRVIAHGENFISMGGGVVINTETGAKYENATVTECSGCPPDIGKVGYEYHAGEFVPCAPFGVGPGNIAVYCDDCKTPRDSGTPIEIVYAMSSYLAFAGNVNRDMVEAAFGKGNENNVRGVGTALAMYSNLKGGAENNDYLFSYDNFSDLVVNHKRDLVSNLALYNLIKGTPYANDILTNTIIGLPDITLYDKGNTEYLDIANATCVSVDEATCTISTEGKIGIDCYSNDFRESSGTVFTYTVPLLKPLPNVKGYKVFNVKFNDNSISRIGAGDWAGLGYCGFNISLGGIAALSIPYISPDNGRIFTGEHWTEDCFETLALASSTNAELKISFQGRNYNGYSGDANIHIDKIWISES